MTSALTLVRLSDSTPQGEEDAPNTYASISHTALCKKRSRRRTVVGIMPKIERREKKKKKANTAQPRRSKGRWRKCYVENKINSSTGGEESKQIRRRLQDDKCESRPARYKERDGETTRALTLRFSQKLCAIRIRHTAFENI